MFGAILIILFAVIGHVSVKGTGLETEHQRASRPPSLRRGDLDGAILGKPGHPTSSPCCGEQIGRKGIAAGTLQLRASRPHRGCEFTSVTKTGWQFTDEPEQGLAFSRRHAVFAAILSALTAPVARPFVPARAEEEKFINGPDGLKYRDLVVGRGAVPSPDDKLTICDVPFQCGDLKALDGALTALDTKEDTSKLFVFRAGRGMVVEGFDLAVLGEGKMPPMRVGGTRKVLIPPKLGYGEDRVGLREGVGCNKAESGSRSETCDIPAGTDLEFTIQLVSIERTE